MAEIMLPIGRDVAPIPVTQADDVQLTNFLKWYDEDPKAKSRMKRADVAVAARAELEKRKPPKAKAAAKAEPTADTERTEPPRRSQGDDAALARVDPNDAGLVRITEPDAITKRIAELFKRYHVVTPATEIDHVPAGFGVSVSFVTVDKNTGWNGPGEAYKVGKKVGLSKAKLEQIWAAAGGEWIPHLTGRLDNGREPRYCHYRAVGVVKNFDGTSRTVSGEAEIDARDGSPLIEEIIEKAKRRAERSDDDDDYGGPPGEGDEPKRKGKPEASPGANQILELRKFLLRHAESKAKNRAIASMGVKRSYNPAELNKPFAVVKLVFTGHSDDPALKEKLALMSAEAALRGSQALYGAPVMALPPARSGHEPPPVGAGETGDDVSGEFIDDDEAEGDDDADA
jgi:hypothetical protein